ncbi:MAG: hypothetical protein FJ104_00725 [Deltaproteobacteria bacterium]|nr:hypothetical protein [Deltaproteobacteria bacterium]
MSVRVLIEALVRQTTVLLAEVATSGGLRAPLASVADQVFIELSRELDAHGVSRSVSADMFGMALRTYLRRIRRYDESVTQQGQSLWEAVLRYVEEQGTVSRNEVLDRFARDEDVLVRGVLQDLTDSGLIFRTGVRDAAVYARATAEQLGRVRTHSDQDALDGLVWALVRREGPLTRLALSVKTKLPAERLSVSLERLAAAGHIQVDGPGPDAECRSRSLVVPLGARAGFEAAVYDHFQAVVKTIIAKLRRDAPGAPAADRVGGSTYGFEVWDGHPLADRVYGQLASYRDEISALRREVDAYNEQHPGPARRDRVTLYVGQCVIEEGAEDDT